MFYSFLHKTTIKSMMTLHNHWKVNLLQGQVFGTACYHKIHYNVDILHLYTNVLMMKTNQVSSFFHDQIGHVYLKFTISDHMVNNRLCNLTPPGSFEHTFVFLFCFLMFEELRHFIIVSIARKGKWITKNKHKNTHFLISDGVQGTRIWKNSFFRGGRSSSSFTCHCCEHWNNSIRFTFFIFLTNCSLLIVKPNSVFRLKRIELENILLKCLSLTSAPKLWNWSSSVCFAASKILYDKPRLLHVLKRCGIHQRPHKYQDQVNVLV